MSVMDSFLKKMQLNGEDDEFIDDYGDDEMLVSPPPQRNRDNSARNDNPSSDERRRPSNVRQMSGGKQGKGKAMQQGMEICAIKPTSMEDTREVTDTLLKNRTVVLNLEGIDVDVAQRIVDFVSGSCYAIRGNLQKISRYIFIITPSSVDISGDFQEMIGGFAAAGGGDAGAQGGASSR